MKALTEVNKVIKKFLSNYGYVNVVCSTDFYYDFEKNEIGWSFFTVERQDKTFCNFFEKELSCPICNTFIYSILHEYGHKMTLGNFSELDWDEYQLSLDGIDCTYDGEEKDYEYYKLPIELAASQWAVDFIKSHYDKIKLWFDNEFYPSLERMFQEEDIAEIIDIISEED